MQKMPAYTFRLLNDGDGVTDDVAHSVSLTCRKEKSNCFRLLGNGGDCSERYVPDYLVTFTGACLERSAINDRDPAAAITKNAALLQLLGEQRDRHTPDTEHFREKLLREQQLVAANSVGTLQ